MTPIIKTGELSNFVKFFPNLKSYLSTTAPSLKKIDRLNYQKVFVIMHNDCEILEQIYQATVNKCIKVRHKRSPSFLFLSDHSLFYLVILESYAKNISTFLPKIENLRIHCEPLTTTDLNRLKELFPNPNPMTIFETKFVFWVKSNGHRFYNFSFSSSESSLSTPSSSYENILDSLLEANSIPPLNHQHSLLLEEGMPVEENEWVLPISSSPNFLTSDSQDALFSEPDTKANLEENENMPEFLFSF